MESIPGWTTLAEQPLVLLKEYGFGDGGKSNCLAVRLPGNKWLLMSPPPNLTPDEAQALEAKGEVVALVENNGFHHLGLGPCASLFPKARTYARERAAHRIRKKGKDYGALEPMEKLAPLLGPNVELIAAEGDKLGDLLMRVRTERGVLLYLSDFVVNLPRLPKNPVASAMFRFTNSGPGLKVFQPFMWFFVTDRKKARASLTHVIESAPPEIMVPAHGKVIASPSIGADLLALLR